mmetsp:Transcript_22384/g.61419  ORF Transcript_22384/g.61419 Transcript_22384/m.61419 type:complete len:86 (+) Transcript_22384:1437-1694(+)
MMTWKILQMQVTILWLIVDRPCHEITLTRTSPHPSPLLHGSESARQRTTIRIMITNHHIDTFMVLLLQPIEPGLGREGAYRGCSL